MVTTMTTQQQPCRHDNKPSQWGKIIEAASIYAKQKRIVEVENTIIIQSSDFDIEDGDVDDESDCDVEDGDENCK